MKGLTMTPKIRVHAGPEAEARTPRVEAKAKCWEPGLKKFKKFQSEKIFDTDNKSPYCYSLAKSSRLRLT